MGYIPIKDKLEEIERRGRQIRRRQEKLKDDAAFLADMLLTRATSDMEAQRRLLREWEEEIEQLEQSLTFLRSEYMKYKHKSNSYKSRKTKSDGREKRKAIFEAKTKCAPKIRVALLSVRLSGQNTSVVQTPFESCLNDAFLLKFPLKYHLKLIANSAEIRIFT